MENTENYKNRKISYHPDLTTVTIAVCILMLLLFQWRHEKELCLKRAAWGIRVWIPKKHYLFQAGPRV